MTNEKAIGIVQERTIDDNTARVFLCEDIIDIGVDEWVKEDIHELMTNFIKDVDEGAERSINKTASSIYISADASMVADYSRKLKQQLLDTFSSMAVYASVHAEISKIIADNDQQ